MTKIPQDTNFPDARLMIPWPVQWYQCQAVTRSHWPLRRIHSNRSNDASYHDGGGPGTGPAAQAQPLRWQLQITRFVTCQHECSGYLRGLDSLRVWAAPAAAEAGLQLDFKANSECQPTSNSKRERERERERERKRKRER